LTSAFFFFVWSPVVDPVSSPYTQAFLSLYFWSISQSPSLLWQRDRWVWWCGEDE
jgi:hypothetical protein